MEQPDPKTFIDRWKNSGAAERANYQLFLSELCDVLGVPRPDPTKPDDDENAYVFERSVTFHHADGSTSTGRIDLYKRGCFVLEAKQGVEKREREEALSEVGKAKAKAAKKGTATRGSALWDEAMLKAQGQAEQYARALPAIEGRPPLLIVVDVGHSIELYSELPAPAAHMSRFPIRAAIASQLTASTTRRYGKPCALLGSTPRHSTRRGALPVLPARSRRNSDAWLSPWKNRAILPRPSPPFSCGRCSPCLRGMSNCCPKTALSIF